MIVKKQNHVVVDWTSDQYEGLLVMLGSISFVVRLIDPELTQKMHRFMNELFADDPNFEPHEVPDVPESDEQKNPPMNELDLPDFEEARRHGKTCFCSECLQDEIAALKAEVHGSRKALSCIFDGASAQ